MGTVHEHHNGIVVEDTGVVRDVPLCFQIDFEVRDEGVLDFL